MRNENYPVDHQFIEKFKHDQELDNFLRLFNKNPEKNKGQVRGKPDITLSAQNNALYSPGLLPGLPFVANQLLDSVEKEYSSYECAVIELLVLYGLRISEVLNINATDIFPNGQIRIRGAKGSEDRMIYAIRSRKLFEFMRINQLSLPSTYNRFYFYRLFKKKGIYAQFGGNFNNSVTHYFRYSYILELLKQGLQLDQIRKIIGHKSINSTIHYAEQLRKTR